MINYRFSEPDAIFPVGRKSQLWRSMKLTTCLFLTCSLQVSASSLPLKLSPDTERSMVTADLPKTTEFHVIQERVVSGRVTDEEGNVLERVTVSLKGTDRVSTTDSNGTYRISIPQEGGTLAFSIVGFESSEYTIGNQTTINVSMIGSSSDLDEVVVFGYATM